MESTSGNLDVRQALRPLDGALSDPALGNLGQCPSPLDIACELCRAMEIGRFTRRGISITQTVYLVSLSPDDLHRFEGRERELVATLKDTLIWWASRHHYEVPGEIRIRLQIDEDLHDGQLSIEAGLRPEEAKKLGRRVTEPPPADYSE